MISRSLSIPLANGSSVSALLSKPSKPKACFVFAHGAGAGMEHDFMRAVAELLALREIATLRYQFPYSEAHSRRPDRPPVCHATVRAAVAVARKKMPKVPLIAGGKSFGGRMTSQAQALEPMPGVIGLAFFGFPWHLPKAPALTRSEHLHAVAVPMLFMQGGRDAMGDPPLVKAWVRRHGRLATLKTVTEADHGFHVLVSSGRNDAQVQEELAVVLANWISSL